MSFQFRVSCERGIVRICCYGSVEWCDAQMAANLVAQKFCHLVPLRVLLDLRNLNLAMSIAEQYRFVAFVTAHRVLVRARVAVMLGKRFNPFALLVSALQARQFKLNTFLAEREALAWVVQRRY